MTFFKLFKSKKNSTATQPPAGKVIESPKIKKVSVKDFFRKHNAPSLFKKKECPLRQLVDARRQETEDLFCNSVPYKSLPRSTIRLVSEPLKGANNASVDASSEAGTASSTGAVAIAQQQAECELSSIETSSAPIAASFPNGALQGGPDSKSQENEAVQEPESPETPPFDIIPDPVENIGSKSRLQQLDIFCSRVEREIQALGKEIDPLIGVYSEHDLKRTVQIKRQLSPRKTRERAQRRGHILQTANSERQARNGETIEALASQDDFENEELFRYLQQDVKKELSPPAAVSYSAPDSTNIYCFPANVEDSQVVATASPTVSDSSYRTAPEFTEMPGWLPIQSHPGRTSAYCARSISSISSRRRRFPVADNRSQPVPVPIGMSVVDFGEHPSSHRYTPTLSEQASWVSACRSDLDSNAATAGSVPSSSGSSSKLRKRQHQPLTFRDVVLALDSADDKFVRRRNPWSLVSEERIGTASPTAIDMSGVDGSPFFPSTHPASSCGGSASTVTNNNDTEEKSFRSEHAVAAGPSSIKIAADIMDDTSPAISPEALDSPSGCQPQDHFFRLSDGRNLCWSEFGDEHGVPLLFFHPLGVGRFGGAELHMAAKRQRIRLICPDRPGVGRSSPWTEWHQTAVRGGASIVHFLMIDMAAFVCFLQLQEFGVIGMSQGGAYALGAAHWLNDLVRKAHSLYLRPEQVVDGNQVLARCPRMTGVGVVASMIPLWYGTKGMACQLRLFWNLAARLKRIPGAKWICEKILKHRYLDFPDKLELEIKELCALRAGSQGVEVSTGLGLDVNGNDPWCQGPAPVIFELDALCGHRKDAWGFRPEDVNFVADDGFGIRYWHGARDELFSAATAAKFIDDIPKAELHRMPNVYHSNWLRHTGRVFGDMLQAMRE